jgi:uncharacterized protein (TIGR02145 family)
MQPTPGGWFSTNVGATNSSGFTALPGGLRGSDGDFNGMAYGGVWWSSSVFSGSDAWGRNLGAYGSDVGRFNFYGRSYGFSVRCCRD